MIDLETNTIVEDYGLVRSLRNSNAHKQRSTRVKRAFRSAPRIKAEAPNRLGAQATRDCTLNDSSSSDDEGDDEHEEDADPLLSHAATRSRGRANSAHIKLDPQGPNSNNDSPNRNTLRSRRNKKRNKNRNRNMNKNRNSSSRSDSRGGGWDLLDHGSGGGIADPRPKAFDFDNVAVDDSDSDHEEAGTAATRGAGAATRARARPPTSHCQLTPASDDMIGVERDHGEAQALSSGQSDGGDVSGPEDGGADAVVHNRTTLSSLSSVSNAGRQRCCSTHNGCSSGSGSEEEEREGREEGEERGDTGAKREGKKKGCVCFWGVSHIIT